MNPQDKRTTSANFSCFRASSMSATENAGTSLNNGSTLHYSFVVVPSVRDRATYLHPRPPPSLSRLASDPLMRPRISWSRKEESHCASHGSTLGFACPLPVRQG